MIRKADNELKRAWRERFAALPLPARIALKDALLDLRADALKRAELQWRRHKAPMAYYWKVVGVYAGHLARSIPVIDPAMRLAAQEARKQARFNETRRAIMDSNV